MIQRGGFNMKQNHSISVSITALALTLVTAASSFAGFDSNKKAVDINDVKAMLKSNQQKATWSPKESWVSDLSLKDAKRLMGLGYQVVGRLDPDVQNTNSNETVDWRNMGGINYLGPVLNQGNCGSCVAFAAVATLEAQTTITTGLPWLKPSFSPQMLFACGGGGCETGWQPDMAAEFLTQSGIPDEACMPYTSGSTGKDASCSAACSDVGSRSMRINGSTQPSSSGPFGGMGGSIDDVKTALKKGPLMTTLTVYSDFVTYGSGIYQHVGGTALGGHAVSLVGFSDEKRAWLIRNSWGQEWGEGGFAWVSWDDVSGVGSETWSLDVGNNAPKVAVTYPAERAYISGAVNLSAAISGNKSLFAEQVKFVLASNGGKTIQTLDCVTVTSGQCQTAVDTTTMKEGLYTIYAQGKDTGMKSQVREFYVINSAPRMAISFVPAAGVDVSKPLSGRPEFVITAQSQPVPMQHVVLQVLNTSGQVVSSKDNPDVLPTMQMGWRTVTVPDGQYFIRIHGETPYQGKMYVTDSAALPIAVHNVATQGEDPAK